MIDLLKSLNLDKNLDCIKNAISRGGEGGNGGEFFFYSYDNKVIIKTINKSELEIYMSKLPKFMHHYKTNPNSLISKIYGVFSF
jgi:1-phosphatidylinositol-4-phosphate 5-kinase